MSLPSTELYTDFNSVNRLKTDVRQQSPEALQQVAKQFESVFINMMLKSMRQANLSEGLLDSQQSEFYRDMYDQQIALSLSGRPGRNGIGIADFIVKQLTPKEELGGQKLNLNDYQQHPVNPTQLRAAKAGSSIDPLTASGFNDLENLLNRLEAQQQTYNGKWQSLEDEWNSYRLESHELPESKHDFISQLLPHARQAAAAIGVDPLLLISQAALETGWGQGVVKDSRGISSFNLFNIKADRSWQGRQAKTQTLEIQNGIAQKEMAGFRCYNSFQESFGDYVNFIKSNPRYSEALKKAGNPHQYIRELHQAGYATDPSYAEKIINIYNSQIAVPSGLQPAG
jgi:peptidoglycan hydrolase FlgJ